MGVGVGVGEGGGTGVVPVVVVVAVHSAPRHRMRDDAFRANQAVCATLKIT